MNPKAFVYLGVAVIMLMPALQNGKCTWRVIPRNTPLTCLYWLGVLTQWIVAVIELARSID
jgi:hypothetical protein